MLITLGFMFIKFITFSSTVKSTGSESNDFVDNFGCATLLPTKLSAVRTIWSFVSQTIAPASFKVLT